MLGKILYLIEIVIWFMDLCASISVAAYNPLLVIRYCEANKKINPQARQPKQPPGHLGIRDRY
jgi:hypothetical protein